MTDDVAGLRHDMEMRLDDLERNLNADTRSLRREVEELQHENQRRRIAHEELELSVRKMGEIVVTYQKQFQQFLEDAYEPLAKSFNEHGHEAPNPWWSVTGKPIKIDG
jgi:hypothetical protein